MTSDKSLANLQNTIQSTLDDELVHGPILSKRISKKKPAIQKYDKDILFFLTKCYLTNVSTITQNVLLHFIKLYY
jgi:hypothetical protein